jgi:hypothetical protein
MDIPEFYLTMLYKLIRKQNSALIQEISRNEHIPYQDIANKFLISRTSLKTFIHQHHQEQSDA